MRIVFISRVGPPSYSGAGRGAFEYARHLSQRGHPVIYLTGRFTPEVLQTETQEGVEFRRFSVKSASPLSTLGFFWRCALWLTRHASLFDVVHVANMPAFWFPVLIAAKLLRKPVYVTMTLFASDDLPTIQNWRLGRLHVWSFRRCDAILAVSDKLAEVSINLRAKDQLLLSVPYSVDIRNFSPSSTSERTRLRTAEQLTLRSPVLIFCGSVIWRKGVDLLIEALYLVKRLFPEVRLYIVGPRSSGREFSWSNANFSAMLDRRISELGLESAIVFTGEQAAQVPNYLKMSDVFVFPSRQEGLPNAVVEAMATGLPVIVCRQPWLPENFIRHTVTGLVCDPTPAALAESILAVLQDQELAGKLGTAARQEAECRYAPNVVTDQLLALYERTR